MNDFMEILDEIDRFDLESQAILVDIIIKRYTQHKREFFIDETVESMNEIKKGNFESGNSDDLFRDLGI